MELKECLNSTLFFAFRSEVKIIICTYQVYLSIIPILLGMDCRVQSIGITTLSRYYNKTIKKRETKKRIVKYVHRNMYSKYKGKIKVKEWYVRK